MSVFDIIILSLLVFGFIRGLFKGFVMGLAGFIGIIFSIYIAKYFSAPVIWFVEWLGVKQEISPAVGFIITFLIALLLCYFVALLVNKFIDLIALGWLNKLLGGVLSFLKYLFIISAFLNAFDFLNKNLDIVSEEAKQKNKLYTPVRKVVPATIPFLHLDRLLEYSPEKE
jgi:membrane protein required for colicin V production